MIMNTLRSMGSIVIETMNMIMSMLMRMSTCVHTIMIAIMLIRIVMYSYS